MANSVVNIGQLPNGTAVTLLGVSASGAAIQIPAGAGGQSLVQAADVPTALAALGLPSGSALGFRNRIINGDFRVDQRNLGTYAPPAGSTYTHDCWVFSLSQASKFTVTRNPSWATLPPGFSNCLGVLATSSYTPVAADYLTLQHRIEGFNMADFAFGTPYAKSLVLSFYVYSNTPGTYGGVLRNPGNPRSYPFSFVIGASNTWQKVTISVPGDTVTGAWATDSTRGMIVAFALGVGSNYRIASTGNWIAGSYNATTEARDVVAVTGTTFCITGVQLEVGSVATPFEMRPISVELQMCQRYFWLAPVGYFQGGGYFPSVTPFSTPFRLPTTMRATPTVSGAAFSNTNLVSAEIVGISADHVRINASLAGAGVYGFFNSAAVSISAEL